MDYKCKPPCLLYVIILFGLATGCVQPIPPAPTVTFLPSAMPTLTASLAPSPAPTRTTPPSPTSTADPTSDWQSLEIPKASLRLKYPPTWDSYPSDLSNPGSAYLLTSDKSLGLQTENTELQYNPMEFYLFIAIDNSQTVPAENLLDWVNARDLPNAERVSADTTDLQGELTVSERVRLDNGMEFASIYLASNGGVVELFGGPLQSTSTLVWENILRTVQFNSSPTPALSGRGIRPVQLLVSYVLAQVAGNYTLPFEGSAQVTCGPGTCETHSQGRHAEAIDFVLAFGSSVYPTKPGTVTIAQTGFNQGAGNFIKVEHTDGSVSVYEHLSQILVTKGQSVKLTTVLGKVGNSGNVLPRPTNESPYAGTHLHFEVYDKATGQAISVRNLVNWKAGCPACSDHVRGSAKGATRSTLAPTAGGVATACQQPVPMGQCIDSNGNTVSCGFLPDPITGLQPTGDQVCQAQGKMCVAVTADGGVSCK